MKRGTGRDEPARFNALLRAWLDDAPLPEGVRPVR